MSRGEHGTYNQPGILKRWKHVEECLTLEMGSKHPGIIDSLNSTMLILAALGLVTPPIVSRALGEVATPALVVDADALARRGIALEQLGEMLKLRRDAPLQSAADDRDRDLNAMLDGALYVHARVVRRAPRTTRYHRDTTYPLCTLDLAYAEHITRGAYLCCGLNNHYDACYYWARSAGGGARLSAPGIALQQAPDGSVEVVRVGERDHPAGEQTNDGKRSEWCEFLNAGDEVDIVPADTLATLAAFDDSSGMVCITRRTRPPGAEPTVAAIL